MIEDIYITIHIEPLAVRSAGHSPNPSSASLTRSHTPEPPVAGPSGTTDSSPPDAPSVRPQPSVPVSNLSEVKNKLKSVIGLISTSNLQADMEDLYACCLVLLSLLEKSDNTTESTPQYIYVFSIMQQDLDNMTQFLNEWTKKNKAIQHMQRKDIYIQVRAMEDAFTRHLNVYIAVSQSESATIMAKEFVELQAKMDAMKARGNPDPRNIEQADSEILRERVHQITGYAPEAEYVLKGQISYRETVPINYGITFDVYRGKFNDGETVAIKILRQKLKNDGVGVRFVERMMRQVQLWSSFSSPFILECRGIGMQMTLSSEEEEYDKFQFYLVSPFMKRGNAVQYIAKLRKEGSYVNILKYLRDAAFGLRHLHHRDPPCVHASIRGENVLIKDDGTASACLNGFGLTKAFTVGKLIELTGDNLKFQWMAPELLSQDRPPLYPSCDIWAWAMTALELITGKQPYYQLGNVRSWTFHDQVVKEGKRPARSDYPTFEQYCPQPDLMWALLEKCWTSASERPTIDKVIEELEAIEKAQIEQQTAAPHIWT
ncbi:kinase-like protein, partial [Rhizoctonia solani]